MSHCYVIEIEVMPERALAAYTRGLSDLEEAWPHLMKIARMKDAEYAAQEARIEEARQKAQEKWDAERAAELEKWESQNQKVIAWERSKSFFRGPKPTLPYFPPFSGAPFLLPRSLRRNSVSRYEEIRDRLKSKRNMAAAAAGPFKMIEADADAMTRWGNGEMVAFLLDTAGEAP